MADLAVTYPTFVAATTILSARVNQNNADIVNFINDRNNGVTLWSAMKVSASTANPVDITGSATGSTELSINNTATDGDPMISFKLSGTAKFSLGVDDSDSDKFKIAHAAALGTAASDDLTIDASTGAVTIRGSATNDSAGTGMVGEFVESVVAATNCPATTQYGDLTSISLTAGDWDISTFALFQINGATWSRVTAGASVTSGNSATGLTDGSTKADCAFASSSTTPTEVPISVPLVRMSLSATTTVYLKYRATFTAGTPQAAGSIRARRVR
jgi:hypothetical protein